MDRLSRSIRLVLTILYVSRVENTSVEYLKTPASNGLYSSTDDDGGVKGEVLEGSE